MPMFKRTMFPPLAGALLLFTMGLAAGTRADGVQPLGQAGAQQPAPHTLGRFNLGSFSGSVELLDQDNDILVYVLVNTDVLVENRVIPGGRPVRSEQAQVWLLLEHGKTAPVEKLPPTTGRAIEACTGGCTANVIFRFKKVQSPVAVVLKWDDELQVFPIPTSFK
jgi:hypothetical protein